MAELLIIYCAQFYIGVDLDMFRHNTFGLECFYTVFEDEIHSVIVENQLFNPGERIAIGASVVSYKELYGWTMDEIVKIIGLKNNCTFCGALDRGATLLKVDKLATGHNADDIAETVLLNILRG
ncbi:Cytoplasmic tRNA 2-thiolation protein 1 [Camellia lanceoleosa]|uniref:Cytoplasmic tRNA 2-thiolation protein 1 n=1 Tax=Camellia lanceoleosa TaxID=1840588 RepID=A0ACC0HJI1_9ERIC|nr:Cytoplasmic tRNA 2-thiolation protein 1 [Camellia lanceoleosa]